MVQRKLVYKSFSWPVSVFKLKFSRLTTALSMTMLNEPGCHMSVDAYVIHSSFEAQGEA